MAISNPLFLFIFLSWVKLLTSQVISSWSSPLSSVSMHATFIVTTRIGSIIQGSIVVPNNQKYTVYFYRPNQYFPDKSAFQFIQFVGSSNFTSRVVDTTGFWRVSIIPNNPDSNYLILVSIVNGQIIDKYVDVARNEKIFVTYFQSGEDCGFNVTGIQYGLQRDISIKMYQGTSDLDFKQSQLIFTNSGMDNNEYDVRCRAGITGYYYIFVSASTKIMPLFPRILINYQSDNYPCPAGIIYKDSNQIFTTCVQIPTINAAYPCLSYDYYVNKCTKCQSAYTLQDGGCYFTVQCGLDNYFHKGECFNIFQNCIDFQYIGGKCKQCENGFNLISTESGVQQCSIINSVNKNNGYKAPVEKVNNTSKNKTITKDQSSQQSNFPPTIKNTSSINQISITCEKGTYLVNGICALIPANCQKFDENLRMCVTCNEKYTLNLANLGCQLQRTTCPNGFTNIADQCIIYPDKCALTNSWGNCTVCIINYTLNNNKCQLKQCPARQYLSNGQCIPVNLKCFTFDVYKGTCTSCYGNDIVDSNGNCNAPQYYSQSSYNGCPARQYRVGNTCYLVDSRCNTFDQYTGRCITCIDKSQILDKSTGKCIRTDEICEDRYYLDPISKRCLQVNPFCDKYDSSTGYCLTCTYGLTLFRGGCSSLSPCGNNQYRNQEGICVNADPYCDGVDQLTGGCLACKAGYQINQGGLCCFAQNYLSNAKCTTFLSQNCQSQRAIFMNCQQCSYGYSLVNGVFGKCKRIGS